MITKECNALYWDELTLQQNVTTFLFNNLLTNEFAIQSVEITTNHRAIRIIYPDL